MCSIPLLPWETSFWLIGLGSKLEIPYLLLVYRWEHLIYQFGCHDNLIKYVIKGGLIAHTTKQ